MRGVLTNWLASGIVLGALALPAVVLAAEEYRPDTAVSSAVALVRPSVVAIETRFTEPTLEDDYIYWQYFRGSRPLYGLWGSGFIYKDPQYVITAEFLMDKAEFIRVILDDGRSYSATLVGKNEDLEVAVLKVDWGPDLEPISPPIGDSDTLTLGQPIAVVGKALNSVDTYTSFGVISAIRKEIPGTDLPTDEFLQFDASYELSFIGGPMVDVYGNVVAMIDRTVEDFSLTNINLAVPINEVLYAADRIIRGDTAKPWFGPEVQIVKPPLIEKNLVPALFDINGDGKKEKTEFGAFITYVDPLSPADVAGIRAGDTILTIDGKLIKYDYDWDSSVRSFLIGDLVRVEFIRLNPISHAWEKKTATLQIVEKPESEEDKKKEALGGSSGSYHHHSATPPAGGRGI
jgi:S1-C subfamily serine protease